MATAFPTIGSVVPDSIRPTPQMGMPIETATATRTSKSTCSPSCPGGAARPEKIEAEVVGRLGLLDALHSERIELSEDETREKEIQAVQVQKRREIDEEPLDDEDHRRRQKEPREVMDDARLVGHATAQ